MSHKILLGLIGGIGPKASNNFCNRLVNNKIVTKEQEHIPFLLFSDPNFEDRTQAILTNKIQNITNKLNNIINLLKQCNVTHIIMLCNTIHFLDITYKFTKFKINKYDSIDKSIFY